MTPVSTERIQICVAPEVKTRFVSQARDNGQTLSDYVITLLAKAEGREIEEYTTNRGKRIPRGRPPTTAESKKKGGRR